MKSKKSKKSKIVNPFKAVKNDKLNLSNIVKLKTPDIYSPVTYGFRVKFK